jgi:hypothetical protein
VNRKQRNKNRATAMDLRLKNPPKLACRNCGEKSHYGHYGPPSLYWPGGWLCKASTTVEEN